MAEDSLLPKLSISLRQTSSSPVKLAITVKNNNTVPVTILAWDSPLDPLAIQLGTVSITSSKSPTPLDIPTIQVSRKLPPGNDSLVEIAAGGTSEENVVELKETMLGEQLRELDNKNGSVKCKGLWKAVWAGSRGELRRESREKMGADDKTVSGNFESEAFDIALG